MGALDDGRWRMEDGGWLMVAPRPQTDDAELGADNLNIYY
jgi:hypothetical protein